MQSTAVPTDVFEVEGVDLSIEPTETLADVMHDIEGKHEGLSIELTNPHGPAGGAAVVTLRGPKHVVVQALRETWYVDAEDLWSVYRIDTPDNFVVTYKTTAEKLQAMLNACKSDGWVKVTPHYQGGRDWLIVAER